MSPTTFSITRRAALALAGALAVALLFVTPGHAANARFDPASFKAAQEAGKSILVDVTAPWCPVCRQQHPIIESLKNDPAFKGLVVLEVDFDTQKDALKQFRVQYQSTLIVFKGATEVARSTSETDAARIRALVAKAF
jgi:thiol-disulfide isomerase/thioredoxin